RALRTGGDRPSPGLHGSRRMKAARVFAVDAARADPAVLAQPTLHPDRDGTDGTDLTDDRAGEAMDVVARLPLLGPLIGWTRAIGPGVMRCRIWACLDDSESEPPLAMMTVGWNRATGAIH